MSGLSGHAIALVIGYLLCLGVLAVRNQVRGNQVGGNQDQANRSGSPAPRRTISG